MVPVTARVVVAVTVTAVQFSPSAHIRTRKDFFLLIKLISGKRESVS